MAFSPQHEVDIFISYSRDDDRALPGQNGWVHTFVEWLRSLILQQGLKGVSIYRDVESLHGNTDFDLALKKKIEGSALFLTLMSSNYRESSYCAKELEWFCQYTRANNATHIGEQFRIVNVLCQNFPPNERSEAFQGATSFPMYSGLEGELGQHTSPFSDPNQFATQIGSIVNALVQALRAAQEVSATAAEPEPEKKRTVFVAEAAESLFAEQQQLITTLESSGLEVIKYLVPPFDDAEAHRKRASAELERADFSIHLFDDSPGKKVMGESESTYAREQWAAAEETFVPKVLWTPRSFRSDEISDPSHSQFLVDAQSKRDDNQKLEVIANMPIVDLPRFIETRLDELERAIQREGDECEKPSFLVDTHKKDQSFGWQLASFLEDNGADVNLVTETPEMGPTLDGFSQVVKKVQNLVFLLGKVEPKWVYRRVAAAAKAAAEELENDGEPIEQQWLLLLPGCDSADKIKARLRAFGVDIVDSRSSNMLNPAELKPIFLG